MLYIIGGVFASYCIGWLFPWILALPLMGGVAFAVNHFEEKERKVAEQTALGLYRTRDINMRSRHSDKATIAESAAWLNDTLLKIFATHNKGISSYLEASLAPVLLYYRPAFLQKLAFSKFGVGSYPPLIDSIECSAHSGSNIQLDLGLKWCANNLIEVTAQYGTVEVPVVLKDLIFETTLRVQMTLIPEAPYISVLHISFADRPTIDAAVTLGPLDLLDIPIFTSWLREFIVDATAGALQWPARYTMDMLPPPQSITKPRRVLINIAEGAHLEPKNAAGDSDPYVVVKRVVDGRPIIVGQTRMISKTVNAHWNETFECLIENPAEEDLLVEVFGHMNVTLDAPMGELKISLRNELEKGAILVPQERDPDAPADYPDPEPLTEYPDEIRNAPTWRALKKASKGDLRIGVTLLNPSIPKRAGVLDVKLIEGQDILRGGSVLTKDVLKPFVRFTVGSDTRDSGNSSGAAPVWKESFHFNVKDADREHLLIQGYDYAMVGSHRAVGDCSLDLATACDTWVPLVNGGGTGQLHLDVRFTANDGGEHSDFQRDNAAPVITEVTEVVWENQRKSPLGNWSAGSLLPGDDQPWCTAEQTSVVKDKTNFKLPIGWVWMSEWEVDLEGGDADGWMYALDFPKLGLSSNFKAKKNMSHFVRKRKWTKLRVFQPDGNSALAAASAQGFVPLPNVTEGSANTKFKDYSGLPSETEVVVENQRVLPKGGFSSAALVVKTDGKPWSHPDDPWKEKTMDGVQLPVGWVWSGPWRVDHDDTDDDGWQYAFDFPRSIMSHSYSAKRSMVKHFVRRRRWTRTRVFDPASAMGEDEPKVPALPAQPKKAIPPASPKKSKEQLAASEELVVAVPAEHVALEKAVPDLAGENAFHTEAVDEVEAVMPEVEEASPAVELSPEELESMRVTGEVLDEVVYENQRMSALRNWGSASLAPTDAAAWSHPSDPKTPCERETYILPLGWVWAGPWSVDLNDADPEGWQYAFDFPKGESMLLNHKFHTKKSLNHFVRRRRWVRPRVWDANAEPAVAVAKRGMLKKRSDKLRQWKDRYCMADKGVASFYQTSEDPTPSIVVDLRGAVISRTTKRANSFQVIGADGLTIHLACDEPSETNQWIASLKTQAELPPI